MTNVNNDNKMEIVDDFLDFTERKIKEELNELKSFYQNYLEINSNLYLLKSFTKFENKEKKKEKNYYLVKFF